MLLRSFGLIAATLTLLLAPPAFGAKFADGTIVERVTSTATAAGTTTLTVSSTRYQRFTGSSTQTVVLPDATTLRTGITFSIMNESSGNVTVQYADASTAVVLTGGQSAELFLASNGSSNGTWNIRRPATLTSTETLTNKTLTSPTINTPTLNGSGGQLTLPAGPDTLVGKATTDTLTNKTIDADGTGNSITNIENADIKAGAAIARNKLASGTASHVVINDGTGVMSSEASLAISRGGTGQATATAAFDALAPTTTSGDIIYHNGTNNVRLAKGSNGQVLTLSAGLPSWGAGISTTAPTVQKFTSGSGTYTTPAGVLYIRVRMVGGGGGGAGGGSTGTNGTSGGAGGNSTFGTTLLTANGGTGGLNTGPGSAGGTASLGAGPIGTAIQGGSGSAGSYTNGTTANYNHGGEGAASPFGGAGGGASVIGGSTAAIANTGSGGGGGYGQNDVSMNGGGGGGAGGYVDAIITSPAASYSYAVGAAGSAGSAGTNSGAGGAGGSGYIIVEEFYQ